MTVVFPGNIPAFGTMTDVMLCAPPALRFLSGVSEYCYGLPTFDTGPRNCSGKILGAITVTAWTKDRLGCPVGIVDPIAILVRASLFCIRSERRGDSIPIVACDAHPNGNHPVEP